MLADGQKYVLNATSALVLEHCDGQTSPEQLTEIVRQKFSLLPAEAEPLAQLALEELETAQLLVPAAIHPATLSRRQALTAFGALYDSLPDGWCTEGERPAGLRGKTLARIPAATPASP